MQLHLFDRIKGGRSKLSVVSVALSVGLVAFAPLSSSSAGASAKVTLSIAYSSDYVMATSAMPPVFYGGIAKQFEAAHPGVTVKLVPIPGTRTT